MTGSKRIRDVINTYLADLALGPASGSHVEKYTYVLAWFAEAIHNNVYVSEITTADMKAFFYGGTINDRRWRGLLRGVRGKKQIAGSSWNAYHQLMTKFCRDIGRPELMDRKNVPLMKVADPDPIILSLEQMAELVASAPTDYEQAILAVAVEYMPRVAEMSRLRIKDYVPERNVIRFTVTKSRRQETQIFEEELTEGASRYVDAWLRTYAKILGWPLGRLLDEGRDYYLFPRRHRTSGAYDKTTGKGLHSRYDTTYPDRPYITMYEVVKRGLARLGYKEEEIKGNGIHCTRRSAACALTDETNNIRLATAALHHAGQGTTERYIRFNRDRKKLATWRRDGGLTAKLTTPTVAEVIPLRREERA